MFQTAALPVGAWVSYKVAMVLEDGTSQMEGTEKLTVLEVNDTQSLVEDVQTHDGKSVAQQDWQDSNVIISAEMGQMFIDRCTTPEIGGSLETVTISAGTFNTCKIGDDIQAAWVGAVNFGFIKMFSRGKVADANGKEVPVLMTGEYTASGN